MPLWAKLLAFGLFILAMSGLHWLQHGFSKDFGFGFSLGLALGCVVTAFAADWRRRERE